MEKKAWTNGMSKPVVKIDSSLNIVAAYSSCREAGKMNGLSHSSISHRCNNRCNQMEGMEVEGYDYAWENDPESIENAKKRLSARRDFYKVAKLNDEGEIVGLYKSASECAKKNNLHRSTIYRHINNQTSNPRALDGYFYADFSDKRRLVNKRRVIEKLRKKVQD